MRLCDIVVDGFFNEDVSSCNCSRCDAGLFGPCEDGMVESPSGCLCVPNGCDVVAGCADCEAVLQFADGNTSSIFFSLDMQRNCADQRTLFQHEFSAGAVRLSVVPINGLFGEPTIELEVTGNGFSLTLPSGDLCVTRIHDVTDSDQLVAIEGSVGATDDHWAGELQLSDGLFRCCAEAIIDSVDGVIEDVSSFEFNEAAHGVWYLATSALGGELYVESSDLCVGAASLPRDTSSDVSASYCFKHDPYEPSAHIFAWPPAMKIFASIDWLPEHGESLALAGASGGSTRYTAQTEGRFAQLRASQASTVFFSSPATIVTEPPVDVVLLPTAAGCVSASALYRTPGYACPAVGEEYLMLADGNGTTVTHYDCAYVETLDAGRAVTWSQRTRRCCADIDGVATPTLYTYALLSTALRVSAVSSDADAIVSLLGGDDRLRMIGAGTPDMCIYAPSNDAGLIELLLAAGGSDPQGDAAGQLLVSEAGHQCCAERRLSPVEPEQMVAAGPPQFGMGASVSYVLDTSGVTPDEWLLIASRDTDDVSADSVPALIVADAYDECLAVRPLSTANSTRSSALHCLPAAANSSFLSLAAGTIATGATTPHRIAAKAYETVHWPLDGAEYALLSVPVGGQPSSRFIAECAAAVNSPLAVRTTVDQTGTLLVSTTSGRAVLLSTTDVCSSHSCSPAGLLDDEDTRLKIMCPTPANQSLLLVGYAIAPSPSTSVSVQWVDCRFTEPLDAFTSMVWQQDERACCAPAGAVHAASRYAYSSSSAAGRRAVRVFNSLVGGGSASTAPLLQVNDLAPSSFVSEQLNYSVCVNFNGSTNFTVLAGATGIDHWYGGLELDETLPCCAEFDITSTSGQIAVAPLATRLPLFDLQTPGRFLLSEPGFTSDWALVIARTTDTEHPASVPLIYAESANTCTASPLPKASAPTATTSASYCFRKADTDATHIVTGSSAVGVRAQLRFFTTVLKSTPWQPAHGEVFAPNLAAQPASIYVTNCGASLHKPAVRRLLLPHNATLWTTHNTGRSLLLDVQSDCSASSYVCAYPQLLSDATSNLRILCPTPGREYLLLAGSSDATPAATSVAYYNCADVQTVNPTAPFAWSQDARACCPHASGLFTPSLLRYANTASRSPMVMLSTTSSTARLAATSTSNFAVAGSLSGPTGARLCLNRSAKAVGTFDATLAFNKMGHASGTLSVIETATPCKMYNSACQIVNVPNGAHWSCSKMCSNGVCK